VATNLMAAIGDDVVFEVPVKDADGQIYPVPGATAWADAKTDLTDPDADAVLSATTDDGTVAVVASTVTVTVTAAGSSLSRPRAAETQIGAPRAKSTRILNPHEASAAASFCSALNHH
jgi:hypothetical protein